MRTCVGTTKEVDRICEISKEGGYTVNKTNETVEILTPQGDVVYKALKKSSDEVWIVRYNPAIYE